MRKCKKIFSFLLSILLVSTFLTVSGIANKEVKADTVPVKLYYAKLVQGTYGTSTTGYIAIKNIAYQKDVTVHYSVDNGITQQTATASYLRTNTDGYEVWSFNIPEVAGQFYTENSFYIQYNVNGQTYYDNNGGNNYKATNNQYGASPSFGMSKVFQDSSDIYTSGSSTYLNSNVYIKGISGTASVKVRYTTNNWQTYSEQVFYTSTNNSSDRLTYLTLNLTGADLTKVHYAICYTVNGIEYWDNNFGINY